MEARRALLPSFLAARKEGRLPVREPVYYAACAAVPAATVKLEKVHETCMHL